MACLLASSCGTTSGSGDSPTSNPNASRTNGPVQVRGLSGTAGRIESIRGELALVVLDYSLSTMPPIGTVVRVVREGKEVGRVRVTGPTRPGTGKIAGEILDGNIQVGDSVHLEH